MSDSQLDARIAEINQQLDSWLVHALERPQGYASSPEALEELIVQLEWFKCIVAGRPRDTLYESGYLAFLQSKGYGSANFCSRHRLRQLATEDLALFKELAGFVKEYLRSP